MNKKTFLLLMCSLLALPFSVIAEQREVEIQLLEMISFEVGNVEPLDASGDISNRPPTPTDFHAYISGRNLTVTSDATPLTRVIVRNLQTNQTIINRQFMSLDSELLPIGSYSIELQCESLILVGQFNAE